jgi:ketosteroid isomerase-like protein
MSQQNVEIARRSLEAMADRDVEELLSLYAPEIELLPLTGTLVGSGGYRGHSGVRNYFAEAKAVWDVVRPEPEAMHAVGDDVIVFGHCAIRGKASKLETREAMAWVITVRDGKVVRHRACRTAADALEAAGMQE